MTKSFPIFLLATFLLTTVSNAEAQPAKIYRVGYLDSSSLSGAAPFLEVFRQRLRELEWVEGKNITFEYRFAEGKGFERLKELAAELVKKRSISLWRELRTAPRRHNKRHRQ